MEEFANIEDEINSVLAIINDFNNGNDELVYEVEKVVKGVREYTNIAASKYLKFNLLVIYLDISTRVINNQISKNEEYRRLLQYCKDELAFYFENAKKLKRYIKKCQQTGDIDNLDSAYLITIYLSDILTNVTDYFNEISKVIGNLFGQFYYGGNQDIREKANINIEVIKQLMKNLEEEGK